MKLQVLCLGLDVAGDDGERSEDWQADLADVGAATGDDEVLVESGEGKFAGASRQEGQGGWDLIQKSSEVSVLLAFLADD